MLKGLPSEAAKVEQLRLAYAGFKKLFPEVPDIEPADLMARINAADNSLVIIDVRGAAEQQVSVLPGPVLTAQAFADKQRELLIQQPTIVTYCTAGLRSGKYAKALREQGFSNCYNLNGSILGWTQEGLPLVRPEDGVSTNRVHTYNSEWGRMAPAGYEPVSNEGMVGATVARLRSLWPF